MLNANAIRAREGALDYGTGERPAEEAESEEGRGRILGHVGLSTFRVVPPSLFVSRRGSSLRRLWSKKLDLPVGQLRTDVSDHLLLIVRGAQVCL